MEIERKYLVSQLPDHLESYLHYDIEQGYLCTSPTLRIRRMGDSHILTVKEHVEMSSNAIHCREEEFSLSPEAYLLLKSKCDHGFITKTRYRIPLTEISITPAGVYHKDFSSEHIAPVLIAELDIFHGKLEGVQLVEVEFPSTEAADAFLPPAWFGQEVSQDPRYRNANLVLQTL
ncbi:MAG: CYTH domain-containing protein [Bacteroidales bacterium]|nr:CYTH domain-containing protein [Bacteroidales bacterium]